MNEVLTSLREPVSWQARSMASTLSNCTWQKLLSLPAEPRGDGKQGGGEDLMCVDKTGGLSQRTTDGKL